jgi:hypothetical protein
MTASSEAYCPFQVGDKVVCVNDTPTSDGKKFEVNQVYTLRWVGPKPGDQINTPGVPNTDIGVKLVGVLRGNSKDYPFASSRFRPLVSGHTELFRSIARDPSKPILGTHRLDRRRVRKNA